MPSIRNLKLQAGPRANPLSYPGTTLPFNYIWVDSWVYKLEPKQERRLGQWGINVDGGPLADRRSLNVSARHLNQALLLANSATMDSRYPVLAIGSNAAPAQLVDKFKSQSDVSRVVPVTRGITKGLLLGHSPHVSNPGYLPYIVADSNTENELHASVLWLDSYQLSFMSETEPNYSLTALSGEKYPLILESGEAVSLYGVYRGKWGALRWPGDPKPVFAGEQGELFSRLGREAWFRTLVGAAGAEAQVSQLRNDGDLRERVRNELSRRNFVMADGMQISTTTLKPYGRLMPTLNPGTQGFLVSATPDGTFPRSGEQYALLATDASPATSGHTHVVISSASNSRLPKVLARVTHVDELVGDQRVICLDQTIRNGIGLELGERVVVRPAKVRRTLLADYLLSKPAYVLCRVQVAGLPTVEQQVCMITPMVLEMIGTSAGDEVVIEGIPSTATTLVPTLRLKGYATPADVVSERIELAGGDLNSRYPSAQDALGVYPDLPWIFLDSATRSALGVDDQKLSVVRVRASRAFQLNKELREAVLLLALAFVGVISILESTVSKVFATALLILLALFLIHRRIRRRLSRRYVFEQQGREDA